MLLHDVAVPVEGRAVVATASVVGGTRFTLPSVYLLTGGQLCDFNADLLARVATEVGVLSWVAGAEVAALVVVEVRVVGRWWW
jgi:hypothetical protein